MKRKSKLVERLSSGSAEFDCILGGGFPTGSVSVIAGDPGTGKTVFTLQMMFHLARQGRRCLYYTTLSEPTLKLIRYVQGFDFFDPALLKERIVIRDLGAAIRADGIASVAVRVKWLTGLTQRSISSTASGTRSRLALSFSHSLGRSARASRPPLMALRVVSFPASTRSSA